MTNWFQTQQARELFDRYIYVEQDAVSCLGQVLGQGPSKRAIIQGGPQISLPNIEPNIDALCNVMRRFLTEAQKQGCVYAEVRCFGDYSAYQNVFEQAGWTYQPHYDVLIYPARDLPEAKARQINTAIRNGSSWHTAQNTGEVKAFYRCLKHLYRTKVHRPLPQESFFLNAWQKGVKVLITTDNQGKITGGVLMPVLGTTAYEWYICGQVMSTWAMIDYCRQHGIEVIDLMGAGEPGVPYGVRDFKLQMGGELKEWGRYICVLKPWIYRLGKTIITKYKGL